jgi:hypothetical protein
MKEEMPPLPEPGDISQESLPPGRGTPIQPGPPISVEAPIRDTSLNLGTLLAFLVIAVVGIVLIVIAVSVVASILKPR